MTDLPQRKQNRLAHYDYSQPGGYFITICARGKQSIFGTVVNPSGFGVGRDDLGAPCVQLSGYGEIGRKYIESIPSVYQNVTIDHYVVMPNHVHLIMRIAPGSLRSAKGEEGAPGSSRPTQMVPRVIAALKRFSNQEAGFNLWQTSYHDHIIRNENDYLRICNYIDTNPAKWREDRYYTETIPQEGTDTK